MAHDDDYHEVTPITFDFLGEPQQIFLTRGLYSSGGTYIGAVEGHGAFLEEFCDVTVNLDSVLQKDPNVAFLNTNGCPKGLVDFLEDHGMIEDTGMTERSGYCEYPLVSLKFEKLMPHMLLMGEY